MAAALIGGSGLGLGVDDFSDKLLEDPTRRGLMRRISLTTDPRCDSVFPDQAPAVLSVFMTNGRKLTEEVMVNRGSPERPLSNHELAIKFSDNCREVLSPQMVEALCSAINRFEQAADLAEIVRIIGTVAT